MKSDVFPQSLGLTAVLIRYTKSNRVKSSLTCAPSPKNLSKTAWTRAQQLLVGERYSGYGLWHIF